MTSLQTSFHPNHFDCPFSTFYFSTSILFSLHLMHAVMLSLPQSAHLYNLLIVVLQLHTSILNCAKVHQVPIPLVISLHLSFIGQCGSCPASLNVLARSTACIKQRSIMSLLSIEKLPQPPIPLPTPLPSVTGMDSLIEIFDLPIEILQIVGRSCNDAKDFVNLLCTCKRMYHAIGGSNSGVWTHFFKNKFDKPKQLTNQRAHTILTALKSKRHRVDLFKRPIKVSSQHTQSSAVNVHFNMKSMLQLVAGKCGERT
jgi:hypothetical protein